MSTKVYSLTQGLLLISLLVTGCAGNKGGEFLQSQSPQEKFDKDMTTLLSDPGSGPALRVYEENKADAYHYAQEVCNYYDAGKEGIVFTGTDFGIYISYERSKAEQEFISSVINVAVLGLCPENRSSLPY